MRPSILNRLERNVSAAKAEWTRASDYANQVAFEAGQRADWVYLKSPARKRYEKAVKALRRAQADHAVDELIRVNKRKGHALKRKSKRASR